jgi:hypothetical protein
MASKADLYRLRAEEADRNAERTKDYAARQAYEELARRWRDMAEQAERNGW